MVPFTFTNIILNSCSKSALNDVINVYRISNVFGLEVQTQYLIQIRVNLSLIGLETHNGTGDDLRNEKTNFAHPLISFNTIYNSLIQSVVSNPFMMTDTSVA